MSSLNLALTDLADFGTTFPPQSITVVLERSTIDTGKFAAQQPIVCRCTDREDPGDKGGEQNTPIDPVDLTRKRHGGEPIKSVRTEQMRSKHRLPETCKS